MRKRLVTAGLRLSLLSLGVAAVVALVSQAGAELVAETLLAAAPWLPVLSMAEIIVATADVLVVRALHGERARAVPAPVWVRSALIAVATAHFLPGGRVLGEVARAASLAPHVGPARGAAVAILTHGTYLLSISAASVVCYVVVARLAAPSAVLEGLLLWSAGFTAALGTLFLVGPRGARIGGWLGRRIGILEAHGPELDRTLAEAPILPLRPLAILLAARAVHLVSAGALLVAVGAGWDTHGAFASEAVQLVAAHVGDTVPGQTGVTEGAYRLFAPSLGLADAAGLAVAMALVIRASRLALATACAAIAAVWRAPVTGPAAACALAFLALAAGPSPAHAQVEDGARAVVHQRLVGVVNPMGVEHMVALGARTAIGDRASPLLAGTYLETGIAAYLSPVYSMTGAYIEVTPLAFLVLRAQMTGVALWSIGMSGAGFYPVDGYEADVQAASLPASSGDIAAGVNVQVGAILQGAVQLGPFRPIVWSQLVLEHERLGEQPFHYSPRYDLVLGREDWMVASSSLALVEVALVDGVHGRLGAYDDLRHVPTSGHTTHQIGPTAMLVFDAPFGSLQELLVLARAGTYLEPARRQGEWTALVGVIARYDLGAI